MIKIIVRQDQLIDAGDLLILQDRRNDPFRNIAVQASGRIDHDRSLMVRQADQRTVPLTDIDDHHFEERIQIDFSLTAGQKQSQQCPGQLLSPLQQLQGEHEPSQQPKHAGIIRQDPCLRKRGEPFQQRGQGEQRRHA